MAGKAGLMHAGYNVGAWDRDVRRKGTKMEEKIMMPRLLLGAPGSGSGKTMLMAGIPATERYAHSLEVDYVPKGLDSAIVEGHKDLRFRNPYDYPVCIHSLTQDGTLTVSIAKADAAAGKQ